ncbi:hypothetical protein [Bullifex porci]|uniref:hypothetical protein n=1 Tax=Bullifex porci TaxID=2606638 RepID=UPI0023F0342B|nr:hypothetical protein [Bullifex porci]MDD7255639.1 hypothetical protein [Bullifex porci]
MKSELSTEYKKIILDQLTDVPQTQAQICNKLKGKGIYMTARNLRKYINDLNYDFINGDSEYVIVGTKQGTYKSKLVDDVIKFNQSKIKHAKSELWSAYRINKKIVTKDQLAFDDYVKEVLISE